jgi:hypothetical protein
MEAVKGFADAGVEVGGVQHVLAVVGEEVVQGAFEVVVGESGEGSADERGGAFAYVGVDDLVGEGRLVELGSGGVDGVHEVAAGVDQGAVEVEDQEAGGLF